MADGVTTPLLPKEPRIEEIQPRRRERKKELGILLNKGLGRLTRSLTIAKREEIEPATLKSSKLRRSSYLISRDCPFMQYWYPWVSLLINYSTITTMYYMSYDGPSDFFKYLDRFVWANFVVDMGLEFFLDFKDEDGRIVADHLHTIFRYLQGWFLFDLIAVIPLSEFGHPMTECYLRIIRILKLKRGLEFFNGSVLGPVYRLIYRPKNMSEHQDRTIMVRYIISFMQILGSMLFTTYALAACFFWWSTFTLDWDNVLSIHFVTQFKMEAMTGLQKLNRSCYFLASTLSTVGYGDYYATNMYEKMMLIGVLLIGITQFSLIVANFNSLLAEIDQNAKTGEGMDELTTWLSLLGIARQKNAQKLKDRIFKHFKYYWENDRLGALGLSWWKEQDVEEFIQPLDPYLNEMPKSLKQGVVEFLFSDLGLKYSRFFVKGTDFRLMVTFHFQPRFYALSEIILEKDDPVQELIFLTKGSVACGVLTSTTFHKLLFYHDYCVVGDYESLRYQPALASFQAISPRGVQAFMLPAKVFHSVLKQHYPKQFLSLLILTNSKANYVRSALKRYQAKNEFERANPFLYLKERLIENKGRFRMPLGFCSRKRLTDIDLHKVKVEYEKKRGLYEEKKGHILREIIRKLQQRAEQKY